MQNKLRNSTKKILRRTLAAALAAAAIFAAPLRVCAPGFAPQPKLPPAAAPSESQIYFQSPNLSFLPKIGVQYSIYVDLTAYRAYLFKQETGSGGKTSLSCLDTSIIACGKPGTLTPLNFLVVQAQAHLYPDWCPTPRMQDVYRRRGVVKHYQRPDTPARPNPSNPLGRVKFRIMDYPYAFRLYGTNEPEKMDSSVYEGANISTGCIRMLDAEDFAQKLRSEIPHGLHRLGNGQIDVSFSQPVYIYLSYRAIREVSLVHGANGQDSLKIIRAKDVRGMAGGELALLDSLSRAHFPMPAEKYASFRSEARRLLSENRGKKIEVKLPIGRAAGRNAFASSR